ncbi:MAG: 5-formyltetrahydrofolate cyclo-ligase [Flavobacteriaceae bacterium]
MKKKALRTIFLERRKAISTLEHDEKSLSMANNCLALPIWEFEYFHLFLPIAKLAEVDTHFLLTLLQGRDKQVILPKVIDDLQLSHILLTDATKIKHNQWQIPEPVNGIQIDPQQIEVVFIPLLCCDLKGHRVGYGKGFYDTFLALCKPDVVKVGLSFFEPVEEIEDVRKDDVRLDFVVTPSEIHSFQDQI